MEVRVYANMEAFFLSKPLFVRSVSINDCVETDYSLILHALRVLFGNNVIVVFVCVS